MPEATGATNTTTTPTTEVKEAATDTGAASSASAESQAANTANDASAVDAGGKPAATLLGAAEDTAAATTEAKPTAPADFPEDWRQKLAGENKADLKTLERINSVADLWKQNKALRERISSGELKKALPENATAEEVAAWRKENGVPDKPEGYEPKVEGLVFGEADKPMLDSFKAHAHGKNWTPAQFNEALSWYAAEQEQIVARQAEADDQFRQTARDELYAEWGPQDFRRNVNAVNNMLGSAPSGLKDRLLGARLADGRLLGDDPAALKWLSSLSREINPAATLVPVGADPSKSLDARMGELKTLMKDRSSEYYRGPNAQKLQTEYRELLDAQSKMKSRAA